MSPRHFAKHFCKTLTLSLYHILNKLKLECASEWKDITKEHQDVEDTKHKSKSIGITNSFNTYNDFYFMSPEIFVSTPTLLPLQNSIVYSIEWLNIELSFVEFVVKANSMIDQSNLIHSILKDSRSQSNKMLNLLLYVYFSKYCLMQYVAIMINADSGTFHASNN